MAALLHRVAGLSLGLKPSLGLAVRSVPELKIATHAEYDNDWTNTRFPTADVCQSSANECSVG